MKGAGEGERDKMEDEMRWKRLSDGMDVRFFIRSNFGGTVMEFSTRFEGVGLGPTGLSVVSTWCRSVRRR